MCFGLRSKLDIDALPPDAPAEGMPGKKDGFYLTCVGFSYQRNINGEEVPECEGIELLTISTNYHGTDSVKKEPVRETREAEPSFFDKVLARGRKNVELIKGTISRIEPNTSDIAQESSSSSYESLKSLGSRVVAKGGQNLERVGDLIAQILGRR